MLFRQAKSFGIVQRSSNSYFEEAAPNGRTYLRARSVRVWIFCCKETCSKILLYLCITCLAGLKRITVTDRCQVDRKGISLRIASHSGGFTSAIGLARARAFWRLPHNVCQS